MTVYALSILPIVISVLSSNEHALFCSIGDQAYRGQKGSNSVRRCFCGFRLSDDKVGSDVGNELQCSPQKYVPLVLRTAGMCYMFLGMWTSSPVGDTLIYAPLTERQC